MIAEAANSNLAGKSNVLFVAHVLFLLLAGAGMAHGRPDVPDGVSAEEDVSVVSFEQVPAGAFEKFDTAIEPSACMASLINVDQKTGQDAGDWLLFSNPDSLVTRERLTIKASNDRGMTWPKKHRLLLDEGRIASYSCLTMIDAQTVGILYEGSQAEMTFQRIPLSDIVGQGDMNNARDEPRAQSWRGNESVLQRS